MFDVAGPRRTYPGRVRVDEIRRRDEAGETIPVIARAIGATRTRVGRALDRNRIER